MLFAVVFKRVFPSVSRTENGQKVERGTSGKIEIATRKVTMSCSLTSYNVDKTLILICLSLADHCLNM